MSASRRRRAYPLIAVAALVVVSGAGAIEPPKELSTVCVDKRAQVFQTAGAEFCAMGERVFRLPQDRPFRMCAELRAGDLRHVTGSAGCTSKERPLTVPDDGPIYLCSGNVQGGTLLDRGLLRRVDDVGQCNPRGETAYVTPAAPQPVADAYSIGEDELLDVPARGVLENDKDLTGAPLTASLVAGVGRGTLNFRTDGGFVFDPRGAYDALDKGETAAETFSYRANDGALDSAPAAVTVTVAGRNDAPVARDDEYATTEDDVLRVPAAGVLANDVDAENHPLTALLVSGPARGKVALSSGGGFTYEPVGFAGLDAGEQAVVTFTYLTRDGTADSASARVTLTVDGRNDVPSPAADAYTTDENSVLSISAPGVLANDADAEGQTLTAELAGGPSAGTLQALREDGSFVFDPREAFDDLEQNETGTATFSYRAVDSGGGRSAPAQVTITVTGRSAPSLTDDVASADEDATVQLDVLGNDRPHGGAIVGVTPVLGNTAGPDADGIIDFTPGPEFQDLGPGATREGSFTYEVRNAEGSSTATARITVAGRNDAPVAAADDYQADDDAGLVTSASDGVLANDTDVDDASLTAVLVSPPAKGRLFLAPDGSFEFEPAGDLGDGQTDTVTFAYRASDGDDESPTTTASIRLSGVNDPPAIDRQEFSVAEGSPAGTSVGTVGYTDPDEGQAHTLAIESGNSSGAFALDGLTGAITVARPDRLDAEATPTFDLVVRVTDDLGLWDEATVRIVVLDVDELPVAADDAYVATGNTRLAAGGATPGTGAFRLDARSLLANDRDPDGDAVTVKPDSGETSPMDAGGARGRYTVAADGSFTYDPPRGFTGTDSFPYTATDGVSEATATVRITVADRVWYVDVDGSPLGDGTSRAPYDGVAPVAAAGSDDDLPGDTLFLFSDPVTPSTYPGSVALEDGQRLAGQGKALVVGGVTLAPATTAPLLSSTGIPGVTLAEGNDLRGFSVAGSGAPGLQGTDFGTLTAALDRVASTGAPALDLAVGTTQATLGAVQSSDSSGHGLRLHRLAGALTAGTATVEDSAAPAILSSENGAVVTISGGSLEGAAGGVRATGGNGRLDVAAALTSTGGHAVEVAELAEPSAPGCSVALRGRVTDSGTGVLLHDNAAGAGICFSGGLTLRTGTSPAFTAVDGGTLTVGGSANTVATTTGTGLQLRAIGIGTGGATFHGVSSDGAASGISVRSLRAGGGTLAVAGAGGPQTGGVIEAATTAGVAITDAANILLSGVDITRSSGDGIALLRTSNVAIRQTLIEDSGGSGLRGQDVSALTLGGGLTVQRSDEHGIELRNLQGRSTLAQAALRNNRGSSQLLVSNTGASAPAPGTADSLTVDGTIIEGGSATGVSVEAGAGSNLRVRMGDADSGTPNFVTGGGTGVHGRAFSGGRLDVGVTRLFRQGGTGDAVTLEAGAATAGGDPARLTFDVVENNPTSGGLISAPGGAGVRLSAGDGGVLEGAVDNNQIDQPGDDGIAVVAMGGRALPDIRSNQVLRPGCRAADPSETRCDDTDENPSCVTVPDADRHIAGVSVTSGEGGTVAGRVLSNQVDDPLGAGVVTRVSAPMAADTPTGGAALQLSGNRVTQTLACSLRANALLATATGGNMALTGGGNTLTLANPDRDAFVIDASAAAVVTAALAGDEIDGGRHGVAATATGADLDVDLSAIKRTGGSGDGVRLRAARAGGALQFGVRDAAAAGGGGISSPAGAGVSVAGDGVALLAGAVTGNEIADAGGAGVAVSGRLSDLAVDDNRITGARESAIAVDERAGDFTSFGLDINGNVVRDAGAKATDPPPPFPEPAPPDAYAAIAVRTERPGAAELRGNTVTGTVHGKAIAVTAANVPLDLVVAANDVGTASTPLTGAGPGIDLTAEGSATRLCLDLTDNASFVSGQDGYRLRSAGTETFKLEDYDFMGVSAWAADRGNAGTVVPIGAFGTC